MNRNIIFALLAVSAIAAAYVFWNRSGTRVTNFVECERVGFAVAESYPRQCRTGDGRLFVEDIGTPQAGPVTVRGVITCLPKKGSGPQTTECAIGLQSDDGKHYSLKNLYTLDPVYRYSQGGLAVEVSGDFVQDSPKGPDGNVYDVVGTINVQAIREATATPTIY